MPTGRARPGPAGLVVTSDGLVEQQREGRAYRYRPAQSRGMTAEVMRDALGEFAQEANQHDHQAAWLSWTATSPRRATLEPETPRVGYCYLDPRVLA
jgi:hypothetical protein